MDLAAANAAHFTHFFDLMGRGTPLARHVEGEGWTAVDSQSEHPLGNYAIFGEAVPADGIQRALAHVAEPSRPSSAFFSKPEAADPQHRILERAGYALAGQLPLMAVELSELKPTPVHQDAECRRIGAEDMPAWTALLAEAYGLPLPLAEICAATARYGSDAADSKMQFFAVFEQGRMVSTSQLFLHDGIAGIYCVTTHPDFRGKGYGALATAEPLRIAQASCGCQTGMLQASAMGLPVYERIGFRTVGGAAFYMREP